MSAGNLLFSKPCQEVELKKCSMDSVVVYKDRAEVKRIVTINIPAGESEVIIKGLSESIDGDSIRIEGQGSAIVLDVTYNTKAETKELDKEGSEDSYKSIMEQVKEKVKELKHMEFRQEAIEKQREMLKQFVKQVVDIEKQDKKDVSCNQFSSLVLPGAVSTMMDFMERYETRVASLDERIQELTTNTKKLNEEKTVLEAKAAKINPKTQTSEDIETVRSVKVTLEAEQKVEIMLVLSYVVSNASWTPAYDVRVFTKDKTMKVHYYGMIKQSTGEEWENAYISLSTAQPDIGGSAPQLGIHYIGFEKPKALGIPRYYDDESEISLERVVGNTNYLNLYSESRSRSFTKKKQKRRSSSVSSLEVTVAKVESGQLYNTTYAIPRTATIASDNIEHKVTIAIIDFQPDFSHISIPRLSPHSFLQAKVKNVSSYALLAGSANVFLDNNFLAKSELSDTSPGEEFTSSLGADQAIRITSHPVKILRGTTGRLTKNNLLTYTHVFTVKNTQANVVKLKLLEQVPLSSDERLKVVVLEPVLKKQHDQVQFSHGHALLNEDNNIEWNCTIPPDTSIDLTFMFSVEFPPNDIVEGIQSS